VKDKKLDETRDYLREWLDKSREVADAAPEAKRIKEMLDWEAGVLERAPPEASEIPIRNIQEKNEVVYRRVRDAFPPLPPVNLEVAISTNTETTSSTTATLQFLTAAWNMQTPAATEYARKALDAYRQLQDAHQRPAKVRALIETSLPTLLDKFDSARVAYQKWKSGHATDAAATLEMRTFVDGLKGELFNLARRHAGDNMNLDIAADRLFSSTTTGQAAKDQLLNVRNSLMSELSDVTKRRSLAAGFRLDGLWSRVLDHALIVVGALREPDDI
jgi:hypothetical protein